MVRASAWARFIEEQKIKEKKRLEKEEEEKKYRERLKVYAENRKLERDLAQKLEKKLERSERKRLRKKVHRTLRLEIPGEEIPSEEDKKEEDKKEPEKKLSTMQQQIWTRKRDEFILTEKEKEKCKEKTLDQLVDEISGSKLVCPPGKEVTKEVDRRELTADIKCFRKRVRRKNPEEIVALYDKLLESDPERFCK